MWMLLVLQLLFKPTSSHSLNEATAFHVTELDIASSCVQYLKDDSPETLAAEQEAAAR